MALLLYKVVFPGKSIFKKFWMENYHIPHNKKIAEDVFSFFPIQFSFPVHWPQGYTPSKISKALGKTEAVCVCVLGIRRTVKSKQMKTVPFFFFGICLFLPKAQTHTCSRFVNFPVIGRA